VCVCVCVCVSDGVGREIWYESSQNDYLYVGRTKCNVQDILRFLNWVTGAIPETRKVPMGCTPSPDRPNYNLVETTVVKHMIVDLES
jgi:hypothetical protein